MACAKGFSAIEWTPANVVTVVRICLIPVFVALMLLPWGELFWPPQTAANVAPVVAAAVFALISLTDSLDGYLARSRNEVTVFGKFMDPIADKILVLAGLLTLLELGSVPSWIPIVIVAREFLVSGLRMLVASSGVVVAASWIGKAKTLTTMVAICLFIVKDIPALAQSSFGLPVDALAWACMLCAVALTIASAADYFAKSWGGLAAHGPVAGIEGRHPAAQGVVEAAIRRNATVGTAESCTGGLIAAALTSVPGSSQAVCGGVVSYDPALKEGLLGVPATTIAQSGVVSGETARAMANGARMRLGVDFAVSTTGVAGPAGGSDANPVGTVWFGLATPQGTSCERVVFEGTREEVRAQATDHALVLLAKELA